MQAPPTQCVEGLGAGLGPAGPQEGSGPGDMQLEWQRESGQEVGLSESQKTNAEAKITGTFIILWDTQVFLSWAVSQGRPTLRRQPHCHLKQAHGVAVSWEAGTAPSACLTGWQSQDPGLRMI